jgi:hypothetical protein
MPNRVASEPHVWFQHEIDDLRALTKRHAKRHAETGECEFYAYDPATREGEISTLSDADETGARSSSARRPNASRMHADGVSRRPSWS